MERHLNLAVATEVDLPSVTLNLFTSAAAIYAAIPRGLQNVQLSATSVKLLGNCSKILNHSFDHTHLAMLTLA